MNFTATLSSAYLLLHLRLGTCLLRMHLISLQFDLVCQQAWVPPMASSAYMISSMAVFPIGLASDRLICSSPLYCCCSLFRLHIENFPVWKIKGLWFPFKRRLTEIGVNKSLHTFSILWCVITTHVQLQLCISYTNVKTETWSIGRERTSHSNIYFGVITWTCPIPKPV